MRALPEPTFKAIVKRWADVINAPSTHTLEIWTPLESVAIRLRRFLSRNDLLSEFFPAELPSLVTINAQELQFFDFGDLENQVGFSLFHEKEDTFNLELWLKTNKNPLALFLINFDEYFKDDISDTLSKLGLLAQKYPHLTLLFFTSQDVSQSDTFLNSKIPGIQKRIAYQHIFSYEDSLHFLEFTEEKWGVNVSKEKNSDLAKALRGHLLLLQAAVLLIRENPLITLDGILHSPSMKRRGIAIFQGFSSNDQKTILAVLEGKEPKEISTYLKSIQLIKDQHLHMPYFEKINNDLRDTYNTSKGLSSHHKLERALTSFEREAFDILMESKKVLKREEIAQAIWQDDWMRRYSDWAIDQVIHRIREKLQKTKAPYKIMTKRGEGFYLVQKKK